MHAVSKKRYSKEQTTQTHFDDYELEGKEYRLKEDFLKDVTHEMISDFVVSWIEKENISQAEGTSSGSNLEVMEESMNCN